MNINGFLKYLCITLICLSSVLLNGCSQTTSDVSTGFYDIWIDYVTFEYANGVIVQKYTVDINEEKLYEDGMSASEIAQLELEMKATFKDFYYTDTFEPRYQEIQEQVLSRTDISVDEKYEYLAGFQCDVNLASSGGEIVAQRTFASLKHYQDFYQDSGFTVSADVQLDENLFFNRYVTGRKNIYYYNVVNFDNFWGLNKKGIYLTETYASPNTDLKSNANLVETTQGIKMHQWEITVLDQSIEFYTYLPVTKDWYILALVLTAFFTIMIALFSFSRIDDTKPPLIKLKKKENFVNLKDMLDD